MKIRFIGMAKRKQIARRERYTVQVRGNRIRVKITSNDSMKEEEINKIVEIVETQTTDERNIKPNDIARQIVEKVNPRIVAAYVSGSSDAKRWIIELVS